MGTGAFSWPRVALCLALGTLLCGSTPGMAGPVAVGFKGGIAVATFHIENPSRPLALGFLQSRDGFTAGAFAHVPVAGPLAVQVEAMYVARGASYGMSQATDVNGNLIGTIETTKVRDDLALSVLARAMPVRGARVTPYFLLGPSLMLKLKEELKTTGAIEGSTKTDDLKSTDVTLTLGGGAETRLGAGRLLIEVRYDRGVSNLLKVADVDESIHTSTWRVMTGYAF